MQDTLLLAVFSTPLYLITSHYVLLNNDYPPSCLLYAIKNAVINTEQCTVLLLSCGLSSYIIIIVVSDQGIMCTFCAHRAVMYTISGTSVENWLLR